MKKTAPSVEIFVSVRDEEHFIQFFYDFYNKRLSNLTINFVDRGSIDRTVEISRNLGIHVTSEPEENFSDLTNMNYKNNCWRNSTADFVIIQDLDELIDVNDDFLRDAEVSAVQAEAWDMIGEGQQIADITKAVRLPFYDKIMVFRRKDFNAINFKPGAHVCRPIYNVPKPIFRTARMYHYNRLSLEFVLEKYARRRKILSPENLENRWGYQYLFSEDQLRAEHQSLLSESVKIF
jgi:hypothetical protein